MAAINQVGTFNARSALENASEKTAELVDGEIRDWLDTAHRDAANYLRKNRATVEKLANELLKRETLTGEEIREIVLGRKKTTAPKKNVRRQKKSADDA